MFRGQMANILMVALLEIYTLLTLGTHAQRGLCSHSACLSVCVSITILDYSYYEAAYERYQQLQCYKGKKNNVAILLK